jgi:hypothetical protein
MDGPSHLRRGRHEHRRRVLGGLLWPSGRRSFAITLLFMLLYAGERPILPIHVHVPYLENELGFQPFHLFPHFLLHSDLFGLSLLPRRFQLSKLGRMLLGNLWFDQCQNRYTSRRNMVPCPRFYAERLPLPPSPSSRPQLLSRQSGFVYFLRSPNERAQSQYK